MSASMIEKMAESRGVDLLDRVEMAILHEARAYPLSDIRSIAKYTLAAVEAYETALKDAGLVVVAGIQQSSSTAKENDSAPSE